MNGDSTFRIVMYINFLIMLGFVLSLEGCTSYQIKSVDYTNQDDNRNIQRREFTR